MEVPASDQRDLVCSDQFSHAALAFLLSEEQFRLPRLDGKRVLLRAVRPEDLAFVYDLETRPESITRWRFAGRTPSPEEAARSLFSGVLVQFVAVSRQHQEMFGLVNVHDADLGHGWAHLAALSTPAAQGSGLTVDAVIILLDYVFESFPLRKLYAEALDFNLSQFGSMIGRYFVEEGTLRDHYYYGGRYWDKHLLSLSRERWQEERDRLIAGVLDEVAK